MLPRPGNKQQQQQKQQQNKTKKEQQNNPVIKTQRQPQTSAIGRPAFSGKREYFH